VEGAADADGAADGDGAADADGLAEALADGLADGLAAAVAGRQIRVSWRYLAKDRVADHRRMVRPSRSAAFCGPIFVMSGTWHVMHRSTMNCR